MNIKKNFVFAARGLKYAFQEPIFRVHTLIAFLTCIVGLAISLSKLEWILIFAFIGWVISLEMINTIIEHIIDLLKPEFHEHAKVLKDLASGAVLVSSLMAAVAGLIIFAPKLYHLFFKLADWLSG